MREILYRAQRLGDKEWLLGYYYSSVETEVSPKHYIITYRYGDSALTTWEIDPETIGQYTGLKDSNGKRIFDGDILRMFEFDEWLGAESVSEHLVKYDAPEFTVTGVSDVDMNAFNYLLLSGKVEVIGNKFDNPELMKGGGG